jgi:hypothetical protein
MNMPLASFRIFLKLAFALVCLVVLCPELIAQTARDACHVYVVDVARARRAMEEDDNEAALVKALATAETRFPEFFPTIGEEELTTKHYSFPGSKLIITASVFYTDESMASAGQEAGSISESMLVGIAVSSQRKASAIVAQEGNAVAELTYDQHTNKVRAKQYVKVRGRLFLVGIECDCMAEKKPK